MALNLGETTLNLFPTPRQFPFDLIKILFISLLQHVQKLFVFIIRPCMHTLV